MNQPSGCSWRDAIMSAKRIALEQLPPQERAAAAQAQKDARARSKARKDAALELARRVFSLHDDGHTASEIARAVGRSATGVCAFAKARGVTISKAEVTVRRAVTMTTSAEDALRRLARDYGATPSQTFEDLATFLFADDAALARRTLRVVRKPAA